MNFIKKPLAILAIVFALVPSLGFAQYKYDVDPFFSYFKDARRYEIGGGIALAPSEFTGVSQVITPGYRGDTTAKRSLTGIGFTGSISISVPIKGTGHISYWCVGVGLLVNEYIWSDLNQTYGIDGSYKANSVPLSAVGQQIGMPLGIDYKIGNDAILSKRLAFGLTLGAGIIPQLNITGLESVSGYDNNVRFDVLPYAKIEGSVFAGIDWKIRVMYSYGSMSLLDVNRNVGALTDGPFNITSKSNVMLSLIIMPFSMKWDEFAWYNTYDTYNQHDKFN